MSHLTKDDLQSIRNALQQRRASLLENIRSGLDESQQHQFLALLGESPGDSSDEALASSLADLSAARIDHEIRQWRELEAAAHRLDDPEFGLCADCGRAIPLARLEANPGAVRCVECQANHERTYAGQGRGSM